MGAGVTKPWTFGLSLLKRDLPLTVLCKFSLYTVRPTVSFTPLPSRLTRWHSKVTGVVFWTTQHAERNSIMRFYWWHTALMAKIIGKSRTVGAGRGEKEATSVSYAARTNVV